MKLPGIIQLFSGMVILAALSACGGGSSGGSGSGGGTTATVYYSLSGVVKGLNTNNEVQLLVYISDSTNSSSSTSPITVTENGNFSTDPIVPAGGSFVILVSNPPASQTCTLSNGASTDVTANVTDLNMVCSATTFSLGGTVSGLGTGQSVTLEFANQYTANVTANGAFTFSQVLAQGSGYDVVVDQTSPTVNCLITNGVLNNASGNGIEANVTNVDVSCSVADSVLHSFSGVTGDGLDPGYALVQATDHNLYGMTGIGGSNIATNSSGFGTIFELNLTTLSESVVHNFAGSPNDGFCPQGALTLASSGYLYGTTCHGGSANQANSGDGTMFNFAPTSGAFALLYSFGTNTNDGINPHGAVVQTAANTFYGVTENGGQWNYGAIFEATTNGSTTTVTTVYSFGHVTNDGTHPITSLLLGSDGNLYGTTYGGGAYQSGSAGGTVFQFNPTTNVETVLHSFGQGTDGNMVTPTAQAPAAALIAFNGYFWGTTPTGGANNLGTIYQVATSSNTYSQVYAFAGGSTDGSTPQSGLLAGADGNLYGTSVYGGTAGDGTMFRFVPAGAATGTVTVLYSFLGSPDGANPYAPLIQANDGHFYGTTMFGGSAGLGTVYRF